MHQNCRTKSLSGRLLLLLLLPTAGQCQAPAGFHWIEFKEEAATVSTIEQVLKSEHYSAIREIGIIGEFALVMTACRERDQPTPMGDEWSVYNISTKTWNITPLISGYNLEIEDWINFELNATPDLAITYVDCWECEPASLFTALHYDQQIGWRARWVNKDNPKQPGIVLGVTDVGDPYTNEAVDQVFAVLAPRDHTASVGTWYHSRDLGSGKITDVVSKFSVDPITRQERSELLTGTNAVNWEHRLCKAGPEFVSGLFGGQDSRACKKLIAQRTK